MADQERGLYMETGKVWLVGAGPGDEGLLTVKGRNALERADAVVYDALVGAGVLAMIPPEAECVYVGKRCGHHAMPQDEISQCLVSLAEAGKRVVRLKGGDPFLFGRGGEEIEVLAAHGIPFEVIPGISSALAVPAYFGIPITHREFCSSVHIITGHRRRGERLSLDFESLCRMGGTLVFLMGVSALPDICGGLLDAGMDENMPAALLSRGTTADQKSLVATVGTLAEEAEARELCTPAVIVVGPVCGLWQKMEWYRKLPLSGMRVVVTRPRERGRKLAEDLRFLGAQVLEIPSIALAAVKENRQLGQALKQITQFQWLVFTSPSGVDMFFEECRERGVDLRRLAGLRIAVIGAGTRGRLEQKGFFADVMPEVYSGAQLGMCLAAQLRGGEKILIPRAREGSKELLKELEKVPDVQICDVSVYDTQPSDFCCPQLKQELLEMDGFVAVFTSASTVRGFMEQVGDELKRSGKLSGVKAACIGEQTRREAAGQGIDAYVAKEATVEALVELVVEMKGLVHVL